MKKILLVTALLVGLAFSYCEYGTKISEEVQKLKDENAALKEQLQPTEKHVDDLPAGYGRGWSCY